MSKNFKKTIHPYQICDTCAREEVPKKGMKHCVFRFLLLNCLRYVGWFIYFYLL